MAEFKKGINSGRGSLEDWRMSEDKNGFPYFINKKLELTQWEHPRLKNIISDLNDMNLVRYAAYRTACKLRILESRLGLSSLDLHSISSVIADHSIDSRFTSSQLRNMLSSLNLNTQLLLSWIFLVFDTTRSGSVSVLSFFVGLVTLCSARLSDKYRNFFKKMAGSDGRLRPKGLLDLLENLMMIIAFIDEVEAFGHDVSKTMQLAYQSTGGQLTEEDFMSWMMREPQTIVWLPTLHRLKAAELVEHSVKCNVCKVHPINGFRYKCMKCISFDICQDCFFSGRSAKPHKIHHPTQEFCVQASLSDETKHLIHMLSNRLRKKSKSKKARYMTTDEQKKPFDFQSVKENNTKTSAPPSFQEHTKRVSGPSYGKGAQSPMLRNTANKSKIEDVISSVDEDNRGLAEEVERLYWGSEQGKNVLSESTSSQKTDAESDTSMQMDEQVDRLKEMLKKDIGSLSRPKPPPDRFLPHSHNTSTPKAVLFDQMLSRKAAETSPRFEPHLEPRFEPHLEPRFEPSLEPEIEGSPPPDSSLFKFMNITQVGAADSDSDVFPDISVADSAVLSNFPQASRNEEMDRIVSEFEALLPSSGPSERTEMLSPLLNAVEDVKLAFDDLVSAPSSHHHHHHHDHHQTLGNETFYSTASASFLHSTSIL